jgi:hypothetical protein
MSSASGRQFARLAATPPEGIARATNPTEPHVLRGLATACLRVVVDCNCETMTLVGRQDKQLRAISFRCPSCRPPSSNHLVIKLDRKRTPAKIKLDEEEAIDETPPE